MKCPSIKIKKELDILCSPLLNNITLYNKNLLFFIVSISSLLFAHNNSYGNNNFSIEWQRTIENNNTVLLFKQIRQTSDGGFITIGSGSNYDFFGGGSLRVVKTDIFGITEWDTSYNLRLVNLTDIEQTRDGGYIISGYNPLVFSDVPMYQFLKINSRGSIEWSKSFNSTIFSFLNSIDQTDDGGYILGGYTGVGINEEKTENSQGGMDFWIIKTDNLGNTVWQNTIGGSQDDIVKTIERTRDGGYIIGGTSASPISGDKTENNFGSSDYWIVKLNNTGNIDWQKTFGGTGSDNLIYLEQTNDDGYIMSGYSESPISGNKTTDSSDGTTWIIKTDSVGNINWQKSYINSSIYSFWNIHQTKDSGYILNNRDNYNYYDVFYAPTFWADSINTDYEFMKLDYNGNVQWQYSIGGNKTDRIFDIQQTSDGNYILAGNSKSDSSQDKTDSIKGCWLVKLNVTGIPIFLTGNVFSDVNNDCLQNTSENGIRNYTLKLTNNTNTIYRTTQNNGKYSIAISNTDTGIYQIELLPNLTYPYYSPSTCNSYSVNLIDSVATANFALKQSFLCPINTVNVSTSTPFRVGQQQTYFVTYCNNGTILSPNTYITIKLDSLLDINSATILYTTLTNHTYRFDIGNLDYLTCGSFSFVATPRIGAVQLNQTLCTEAHIYPDTVCTTPNYTGSYIVASSQCLGDSVELKLENRGDDMQVRKRYIVIEDQVMRINRDYQLPRNEVVIEKFPANSGNTYRITAEQEDAFPLTYGDKFATAAIEACRPNPTDNFSTGYFTQFPNYDGEPFRAMSCNVIVGSYDPNDKVASPVGYDTQHFIDKNTQIDYQINFQNTGNDTAFKVVVVDTIAPTLDINSIQLGVASHEYQFQRTDSNVVQFVFDNILLVDSFRNEPKSHGFIKFKIQQKLDNPISTKIYNKADIYFDYNAPIVTNQTYHTVGQNFVTINLLTVIKNPKYNVKEVKIFPNPFRDKTQVIVEAELLKNPVLLLINIQGKIIKTIPSNNNNNTFDIYREDLSNGMYLFKIMQNEDEVVNGKVIVQ